MVNCKILFIFVSLCAVIIQDSYESDGGNEKPRRIKKLKNSKKLKQKGNKPTAAVNEVSQPQAVQQNSAQQNDLPHNPNQGQQQNQQNHFGAQPQGQQAQTMAHNPQLHSNLQNHVQQLPYPPQNQQPPHPPQNQQTPHPPQNQQTPHPPQNQQHPHPPPNQQLPHPPHVQQLPHQPPNQQLPCSSHNQQLPCPPQNQQLPYPPISQQLPYPPQNPQQLPFFPNTGAQLLPCIPTGNSLCSGSSGPSIPIGSESKTGVEEFPMEMPTSGFETAGGNQSGVEEFPMEMPQPGFETAGGNQSGVEEFPMKQECTQVNCLTGCRSCKRHCDKKCPKKCCRHHGSNKKHKI